MRARCTFCGADYEAPVTRAALALVGRCEYCRRARLESVEDGAPPADESPAPVVRIRSRPPPEGRRRGRPSERRTVGRRPSES